MSINPIVVLRDWPWMILTSANFCSSEVIQVRTRIGLPDMRGERATFLVLRIEAEVLTLGKRWVIPQRCQVNGRT